MKILHVLQSGHFSGAENVACQIIGMTQTEAGVEAAYCSAEGEIRKALEKRNITFFPMKQLCKKELSRVLKEYKPDIIHAHDMRASFISAIASHGIPIVSHIHNSDFKSRKISVKSLLYLLGTPKFSSILWVSKSCFEGYAFHKLLSNKSKILYNVINGDEVRERAKTDNNSYDYDLVYIGRLANPKNPLRLIRIIEMLKRSKNDLKVGIVGTGDLESITRQKADEANLSENIVFHGFMSNPLKILKSSKAMVITSDREGLPMVALEAMALGVPIVSTPTDGLCDIVKPGVNGFLESDESEFAKKVLFLISDMEEQQKFSQATLREFARINNTDNYKDVLNEVYNRK